MTTYHSPATRAAYNRKPCVLLIDDQEEERKALTVALEHNGFEVHDASNDSCAKPREDEQVDVVVSSLGTGKNAAGIRLVRSWRQDSPETPVIAIAGEDQLESAVEAMRVGAADCLTQPVHPDMLTASLRSVLSIRRVETSGASADAAATVVPGFESIVGHSRMMLRVFDQAERVAPTSASVLLTGATGTGKELLAQAIHRLSRRNAAPFVAVNVAAVPETLIESELFGHVKGAFTDAMTERVGRFESADGGTLFVDEIGDLNLQSQAKLLRVLETRVINRVGSNEDIPVDVRVVAATSRNLERMIAAGDFRADLYYRLNVVRIELPELRQRREDIPLLVMEFLKDFAAKQNTSVKQVDAELMDLFQAHSWPGNVRQLKNCLESMLVMTSGNLLTKADLPDTFDILESSHGLEELALAGCPLVELERQAIQQTLRQNDGNRTRSAEMLGISVRTLQRKLKAWEKNGPFHGPATDMRNGSSIIFASSKAGTPAWLQ